MILKNWLGVVFTAVVGFWLSAAERPKTEEILRFASCNPALNTLFTPARPVLGRYQVCTDPRTLAELSSGRPVEAPEAPDAFGVAGSYDRAALARLYGGTRPLVTRRWEWTAEGFESFTLVSPHPNATFTRLEPGTLIIRWICEQANPGCRMTDARK
jgi:hypothetical protein